MPYCPRSHFYAGDHCHECGPKPTPRRARWRRPDAGTRLRAERSGVRVLDTPRVTRESVSTSMLASWLLKLAVVAAVLYVAWHALLPGLISLLLRFAIPFLILYVIFRLVVPVGAARPRGGHGYLGMVLMHRLLSPSAARPSRPETITTFLGEEDGRRRGYELRSRRAPFIEHGDVVRVVGVRSGDRTVVLALRSDIGWVYRSGLLAHAVIALLLCWVLAWWLLR